MINEIEFRSEGAIIRGLLFMPETMSVRLPVAIMAHGTSATVKMVADKYAEVFGRNGFAALLYDHRNFGRSEGEPRQEINPWIQCRGYRGAISYAETLPEVDRKRIALWGDSYTGGQVVMVAAMDDRVKAIVAQCPVIGETFPMEKPNQANVDALKDIF